VTEYQLATATHRGNVGIRTGSTGRSGGRTHLYDPAIGRTLCGRRRGEMVVHEMTFAVDELPVRYAMCRSCWERRPHAA
jgi:hypothetical protein